MRPRRAPAVVALSLALLLATALAAAGATSAGAEELASPRVIAPLSETPPPVSPLARAEGAGWMTAPTLTDPPPAAHVSIAQRWWFWASLGAAAVAVVIAGFTIKPGQPYAGNSGLVSLP